MKSDTVTKTRGGKTQQYVSFGLFGAAGICFGTSICYFLLLGLFPSHFHWIAGIETLPQVKAVQTDSTYLLIFGLILASVAISVKGHFLARWCLALVSIASAAFLNLFYLWSSLGSLGIPWYLFAGNSDGVDRLAFLFLLTFLASTWVLSRSLTRALQLCAVLLIPLCVEVYIYLPGQMSWHVTGVQADTFLSFFSNWDLLFCSLSVSGLLTTYRLIRWHKV